MSESVDASSCDVWLVKIRLASDVAMAEAADTNVEEELPTACCSMITGREGRTERGVATVGLAAGSTINSVLISGACKVG